MTAHTPDLAAMISTRICHDLVNPIGAISNGLELLVELNQQTGPEIGLITVSVASANAKLGFFRVAFGDARTESELPTALAAKTMDAMYSTGRFRARWQVTDDPLFRAHVKLAFLLVQCIESSLPLGGTAQVTRNGALWTITGKGSRLTPDEALWAAICDNKQLPAPVSSNVHFAVAQITAARLGAQINFSQNEEQLTVSFAT